MNSIEMATPQYMVDQTDLECAICMESWVDKDPRTLPCQHTFCLPCLQSQEHSKKITCAICRTRLIFPKGGVTGLPKNLFANNLKEIKDKTSICNEHKKELIQPSFYCKSCNIRIMCMDCLEVEHSRSSCRIISCQAVKDLNRKCIESICIQREKNKKLMKNLLEKLYLNKKLDHRLLDEKYKETEKKIKRYFDERDKKLNNFLNQNEKIFLKEQQLDEYLKKISKEEIIIDGKKKIINDQYIRIINTEKSINDSKRCLIRIKEKETFNGNIISLSFDGIYYRPYNSVSYKFIYFQSFSNNVNHRIELNREISDFKVTTNYIFGICFKRQQLYLSNKGFNGVRNMELLFENMFKLISAREDNNSTLVITLKNNNSLTLIMNNEIRWSRKNYYEILDGSFSTTGNPLLILKSQTLIEHDKLNGNVIRWINCRGIEQISSITPNGLLLLFTCNEETEERLLYYVDEEFCQCKLIRGNIKKIYASREVDRVVLKIGSGDRLRVFRLD